MDFLPRVATDNELKLLPDYKYPLRINLYWQHVGGFDIWHAQTEEDVRVFTAPFISLGYFIVWGYK